MSPSRHLLFIGFTEDFIMRSTLSQGQSKNILQQYSGFEYLGNAPCLFRATSGTLASAADTSLAAAPCDGAVQGIQVKVTTAVAGGDSTLTLKVGGVATDAVLVIPEGTPVGTILRLDLTSEPVPVSAGDAVAIGHDAVATAGVAFLTVVLEPF